jgi:hypothetical protein
MSRSGLLPSLRRDQRPASAHMTMLLVKVYHRGIGHLHISWDPGLARLHDAARVLEPGPAHMRSPLGTAAPLSRLRRARAQESETSLLVGI